MFSTFSYLLPLFRKPAQQRDLFCISVQLIRCFQIERQSRQRRMCHDPLKCRKPQRSLADLLMAVLMALKRILAVVQMNRFQLLKSYHAVEPLKHIIEVIHNIVSRIVHMARIQADTHVVF